MAALQTPESDGALELARRALSLVPEHPVALHVAGIAAHHAGEHELALDWLAAAGRASPGDASVLNSVGNVASVLGRWSDAETAYRGAVALAPGGWEARLNLGTLLLERYALAEAKEVHLEMLRERADDPEVGRRLGSILSAEGRLDEGAALLRRAVANAPERADIHSDRLLLLNYDPDLGPDEVFAEHLVWRDAHCPSAAARPEPTVNRGDGEPLRVGFVSPDFRAHAVSYFFEPLLEHRHRERYRYLCFASVRRPDEVTARLRGSADEWHDILRISDADAAGLVTQRRVDILIDLAGHTGGNRLGIFALKPAPVQMTYLGYPNTTAVRGIDFRITDAFADPRGAADTRHTETLLRLPHGFLTYRPYPDSPPVARLPAERAGHVTFGSFNNVRKINARVLDAWSALLRAVPEARMLVKCRHLGARDARAWLGRGFTERGVSPERVELLSAQPSMLEHLSTYHRVDVALDTFPYNGTTTTCEALWMGVPVVTLAGSAHAGRVGVSLLSAVGLEGLIAADPEDYVRVAAGLAESPDELSALREGLRGKLRASALTDGERFTSSFEAALRSVWSERANAGSAHGRGITSPAQ